MEVSFWWSYLSANAPHNSGSKWKDCLSWENECRGQTNKGTLPKSTLSKADNETLICLAISCDGNSTKTTLILRDGLQCLQQSLLYDFQVFLSHFATRWCECLTFKSKPLFCFHSWFSLKHLNPINTVGAMMVLICFSLTFEFKYFKPNLIY